MTDTRLIGGQLRLMLSQRSYASVLCLGAILISGVACAHSLPRLPTEPGLLDEETAGLVLVDSTVTACDFRTITAEVSMQGRVAGHRIRGRFWFGKSEDGVRMESVDTTPPAFVLTAMDDRAMLVYRGAWSISDESIELI